MEMDKTPPVKRKFLAKRDWDESASSEDLSQEQKKQGHVEVRENRQRGKGRGQWNAPLKGLKEF